MAATKQDIMRWFKNGVDEKQTHMIVVCDCYDYEDYPVYVGKDEDVREIEKYYNGKELQAIMEVYNLRMDLDSQMEEYRAFIKKSMKEMYKVLNKGKYCIVEVGDVKKNGKKVYLDHLIVELADEVGFKVEKVIVNYMTAPKISKAFSRKKNKYAGTKTNRCVVMKKT